MKTLLAKFYKSLACRVALALVATASVARAHDLPQHFPLAPTDWGMVQQDCMGYQCSGKLEVDVITGSYEPVAEIAIAQPDVGNPPEPHVASHQFAAQELIGPALYDGVDCATLEYYYRNAQSDQLAGQRVEFKQTVPTVVGLNQRHPKAAEFEFHKSFFAACSCDFEHRQANRSITPPKFTLKRTYVEDHFAIELNILKPLVLRDLNSSHFTGSLNESLAIAVPTNIVQNKVKLAQALSLLTSYDCIARSEFSSSQCAFELGELTSAFAKTWFSNTLPSASKFVVDYANNLKPAKMLTTPSPMFVIFQTEAGNEVAIPISQAKDWERSTQDTHGRQPVAVSKEFKDIIDSANARLQWAGGRLSAAASYMNEWFSDRLALAKSDDLR